MYVTWLLNVVMGVYKNTFLCTTWLSIVVLITQCWYSSADLMGPMDGISGSCTQFCLRVRYMFWGRWISILFAHLRHAMDKYWILALFFLAYNYITWVMRSLVNSETYSKIIISVNDCSHFPFWFQHKTLNTIAPYIILLNCHFISRWHFHIIVIFTELQEIS